MNNVRTNSNSLDSSLIFSQCISNFCGRILTVLFSGIKVKGPVAWQKDKFNKNPQILYAMGACRQQEESER